MTINANLLTFCMLITGMILAAGCGSENNKKTEPAGASEHIATDSSDQHTMILKESFNLEDTVDRVKKADSLFSIKNNFKRINSITRWTRIDTTELWESGEDGAAKFYYMDNQLERMVTQLLGETFQQLTEYYLLEGKLSFVFEKTLRYNRPIYYDSTAMKAEGDTEAFDLKKSTLIERRSYFNNERLIYQVKNPNDPPTGKDLLPEEEERIRTEYEKLIRLSKTH